MPTGINGVYLLRFAYKKLLDKVDRIVGNVPEKGFGKGDFGSEDFDEGLLVAGAVKGQEAAQQHIGQHAHGPENQYQNQYTKNNSALICVVI